MSIALFLRAKAVLTIGLAALTLAVPQWLLAWFGLELNPSGLLIARLFGALLLGVGLVLLSARGSAPLSPAACYSIALGDAIATVIVCLVMLEGLMKPLGWSLAVIYAVSAMGFVLSGRQLAP